MSADAKQLQKTNVIVNDEFSCNVAPVESDNYCK